MVLNSQPRLFIYFISLQLLLLLLNFPIFHPFNIIFRVFVVICLPQLRLLLAGSEEISWFHRCWVWRRPTIISPPFRTTCLLSHSDERWNFHSMKKFCVLKMTPQTRLFTHRVCRKFSKQISSASKKNFCSFRFCRRRSTGVLFSFYYIHCLFTFLDYDS